MFRVNNRKSCKPGNFTKYRIRRDEIIHQLLILRIPAKANTDSEGNANGIPGRRRTVLGA
jgi:hypothetical protein